MTQRAGRISRYCETEDRHAIDASLESIFFEASATKSFPDDAARAAFYARWLGNYLEFEPEHAFIAEAAGGRVAGYAVGSLVDPATDPRHDDLRYFVDFAPATRRFPAHLHINLAPEFRSTGLGSRLIEAFCAHAAAHGSPGVHVVTGQGMRNVGFYLRNGFHEVASATWNGKTLLMLGRPLP